MKPDTFIKVGKELFGRAWRQPMADELGVSLDFVKRLSKKKKTYQMPLGLDATLQSLLNEKKERIDILKKEMKFL